MSRFIFTSRSGGVSNAPYNSFNLAMHVGDNPAAVTQNRLQLADDFRIPATNLFFMNQVHGKKVIVIDEKSDSTFAPDADALFTTRKDVALVTLVADCIPLLLESPRAVAAVHVGRRGLALDILREVLNLFESYKIKSDEISAHIGPSICVECYEVDQDVYDEFVELVPAASSSLKSASGKPCLDIELGLISQLNSGGIKWERLKKCTSHDDGYFSYRRDGITGRQAGVISLMGAL